MLRCRKIPRLLEEVVVVGYGTMEKKQVTSSVTSLSAGDMMKGVGGADITSSLQGKISGLILQNNGSANGDDHDPAAWSDLYQLR